MDEEPASSRRLDEETLRYLTGALGSQREVEKTSLFPANRQESLVVEPDPRYYPESIESITLEIRLYTNGDVHITYLEDQLGTQRQCRWDRHDQDHNDRDHFHPLPDASTSSAESREYPREVTTVLRTIVLPWIHERLGDVWDDQTDE